MRWGLIPHWAKDHRIGSRMINARAETVAEKPSFRDSLRRDAQATCAGDSYRTGPRTKDRKPHDQRKGGDGRREALFSRLLRRRRCLVLADGFYEWQRNGKEKRPMRVVMRSGEPFAFAGIWSVWKDPEGNRIPSCAIITTTANDVLEPIHERMPVVLPREAEQFWLDPSVEDPAAITDVLNPAPDDAMNAYEVSSLVNSVANNRAEVTQAV